MDRQLQELKLERTRRHTRADFELFCHYQLPKFRTGAHLQRLTSALQRVKQGSLRRLMVFMPPRHGKSTAVSQLFPCDYFGTHPRHDIMQVGYGDDIALFHSEHALTHFSSHRFSEVYPGVAKEMDAEEVKRMAVKEWTTIHGGRYRAGGILSGFTGRGANLILIDDPVKNRQDANSPAVRSAILREYRSTLYTRLTPDGAIILVMTRWHRDDLAGTLLQEMENGGEQWEIIKLPAISDGRALWPEVWPLEKLLQIKAAIGSAEFEALYQQNPLAAEGPMFKREWFDGKIIPRAPDGTRWVRFWDLASTKPNQKNRKPDWTAGALIGQTRHGQFVIGGMQHMQGTPLEVERRMHVTAQADGVNTMVGMEEEGGSSGKIVTDKYRRLLGGFTFKAIHPQADKTIRAKPLSAAAEAGNLLIVQGDYVNAMLNELEVFPNGDNDDQVDALSGGLELLTAGNTGMAKVIAQNERGRDIERWNRRTSEGLM